MNFLFFAKERLYNVVCPASQVDHFSWIANHFRAVTELVVSKRRSVESFLKDLIIEAVL